MTIADEFGLTDSSSESGEQQQQLPNGGGRPGMSTGRPSAREIYEAGLNRQSHRNVNAGNNTNVRRDPSQRGGGPSRAASQRARSTSILEVAAEEDSNRCSEARRAAALVKVLLEAAPP